MAFEPSDFEDLVRFLDAHPDWRDQLRRRILSDEFLRLPLEVQSLSEGMAELRSAVDRLTEAQDRTDQAVSRLIEAQARTEARVEELAAAQGRTEQKLAELADGLRQTNANVRVLTIRVDALGGRAIEARFRDRASAYFGLILKGVRVVAAESLDRVKSALNSGTISEVEFNNLDWLDGIVRGRDTREAGAPETLLALEVSLTIDLEDVERASTRAAILRKAGYRAFGAVGGETITPRAAAMAEREDVLVRFASPDGMPRTQSA